MKIDVHIHCDSPGAPGVNVILAAIEGLRQAMSQQLEDLTREVGETVGVVQSAITLIRGLKEQLDAAGTDAAKLQELSASLDATQQALADAIAANTPAPSGDAPAGDTATGDAPQA